MKKKIKKPAVKKKPRYTLELTVKGPDGIVMRHFSEGDAAHLETNMVSRRTSFPMEVMEFRTTISVGRNIFYFDHSQIREMDKTERPWP